MALIAICLNYNKYLQNYLCETAVCFSLDWFVFMCWVYNFIYLKINILKNILLIYKQFGNSGNYAFFINKLLSFIIYYIYLTKEDLLLLLYLCIIFILV